MQVRQTDVAGNPSSLGRHLRCAPDSLAACPGYHQRDRFRGKWILTGTAAPGSAVTILDGKTPIGTTTADAMTGLWSAPGGSSAVGHDETATATDTGGTGPASNHWYLGTTAIEPIVGTAGADTFVGNGGNDKLAGGAGNDRFRFQNAQLTSGVTDTRRNRNRRDPNHRRGSSDRLPPSTVSVRSSNCCWATSPGKA